MLKELHIMRGFPGAGKSTIAKRLKEADSKTIVLSRDDFRLLLDMPYSKKLDSALEDGRRGMVYSLIYRLDSSYTLILDDTHLKETSLSIFNTLEGASLAKELTLFIHDVTTPVDVCASRNETRKDKKIPKSVLDGMVSSRKDVDTSLFKQAYIAEYSEDGNHRISDWCNYNVKIVNK